MKGRRNTKRRGTKRQKRQRRQTRRIQLRRRGGSLGSIPDGAIVSIQQDPYSARLLVDAETAANIFEARDTYKL